MIHRMCLSRLDEINVTRMNQSINMMKTTLDQMGIDLSRTSVDINTTRNDILELDKNVSSIYNDSASLER